MATEEEPIYFMAEGLCLLDERGEGSALELKFEVIMLLCSISCCTVSDSKLHKFQVHTIFNASQTIGKMSLRTCFLIPRKWISKTVYMIVVH